MEKKLNEIEEALSQEANAVPIEEIILKLRIIHEEWFNLFKPEQRGENLENKKIKELQGRWEHIVWLDLKKFWGLRESWDSFIIDIWEEANFLKSKFQEFYSNDLNNKNRLPDFIRNLLEKRSESEEKLKQNIYQVLEEEQTLFWHPSVSRTTRILPAYFEGGEGKLSAKRIKGRKKINLKKQKKPQIDLEIISDDYAQADLSEIMESFWGGDHDLADHIAKHPKTKNLDGGRQRDLFFKCLFRYRDRLIRLSTKKKKNQELWVEKKD
ncbi:MAG: hypothetical protein MRZ79_14785 [Bacteroidia bacterium]|nr:hypothetical protein [Bacteroidia bacterium]